MSSDVGAPIALAWALVGVVWWLISAQRVDGLTADWLLVFLLITVVVPVTLLLLIAAFLMIVLLAVARLVQ